MRGSGSQGRTPGGIGWPTGNKKETVQRRCVRGVRFVVCVCVGGVRHVCGVCMRRVYARCARLWVGARVGG